MIDSPFIFGERSEVYFAIHDGETKVRRVEYESGEAQINFGMTKGSIALIADLSAVGVDGVENRKFEIRSTDESLDLADGDVAADVLLGIDADDSG